MPGFWGEFRPIADSGTVTENGWIKPRQVVENQGGVALGQDSPEGFKQAMPFTTVHGTDVGRCSVTLANRQQCKGRKVKGKDICPAHVRQEMKAAQRAERANDGDSG